MTTEVETLRDELGRLSVSAHVHISGQPQFACPPGEVCISEEDQTTALVLSPSGDRKVHIDPMTAYGVLCGLPDGAGSERVWQELIEIDHGG
jgi:hypothetical protein